MYGGRVAQLGPGCGKMKNVKNAKMGVSDNQTPGAWWGPNFFWGIPYPN